MIRIGSGYDVHPLVPGRKLVLGGVEVPFYLGLQGHSDADVLVHSVCDALLGAIGEGDIGRHFPDTDPVFRGISSLKLLGHCMEMVAAREYGLGNLDATIIAQRPKLAAFIPEMTSRIAVVCKCDISRINVKATTTEELGFEGRGEGIAAQAVVLLRKSGSNQESDNRI